MKMLKRVGRLAVLSVILVLAMGSLTACSNSEQDLVGTWLSTLNDFQYDFYADGTGVRGIHPDTEEFTWRLERNNLIMNFGPHQWPVEEWGFRIRGNTITFTNRLTPGYVFEFERVE
ncbi:MAG: DUF5640 domain-containing protein [Oscillospiraceae bacterium]|nr:DUF5640 domain-containing protein [Oscillospiraceae bacterium]